MYVKIPVPVSHAQRRLIRLIENREFTGVVRSYGISPSNVTFLYRMATGQRQASFIMIFNLRQHIEPAEWFYDENEKLPKKKRINSQYACFDYRARQHIIKYPTLGVVRLENLFQEGKLQGFCRENGVDYRTLYGHAVQRKRHDGITGYHSRPGYGVIRKLRDIIHPDDWFIFPEEA